ncbi:MAG: penicillin-binding protein 1C [Flavobacteriaceae bacterium]|nr:penicillin-binding protein 1C [Flavobacteriaceae bacterium]
MNTILKRLKKTNTKLKLIIIIGLSFVLCFWFCLPAKLFDKPTSTVLEDRAGNLLSAKIADDQQWRFPQSDSIPIKFEKAILQFEDKHFYYHLGVNPISVIKALVKNIKAKRVVSGASTITMQTMRMARGAGSRSVLQKTIEVFQAIRLEFRFSKKEILNIYSSNAPFGGNIVGLEAAAWRYYGRKPHLLSWAETATLAVLPNSPSIIYPGKNQEALRLKRNRLLVSMCKSDIIDKETLELALEEELPQRPYSIPSKANHLMDCLIKKGKKGLRIKLAIDPFLQDKLSTLANKYHDIYSGNEIHNIAILVLDNQNSKVLAYIGNANCNHKFNQKDVDMVQAYRSTGSILKPILYESMLADGEILPKTLISDVPINISGYSPKNFDKQYRGIVPADRALYRSLNIPYVSLLYKYGLDKFYYKLKSLNINSINKPAVHYGLSLILGGAEASLWDMTRVYMQMAQKLRDVKHKDELLNDETLNNPFDAGAIWLTLEALSSLTRPSGESGWDKFGSSQKVSWKTGTSFGHKDAWAIGLNYDYTVGIWVGNADGEGRPGLTGVNIAGPVMFDVFKYLKTSRWFDRPEYNMSIVEVCDKSGYIASDICPDKSEKLYTSSSSKSDICPYHKLIYMDSEQKYRVNDDCYSVSDMAIVPWFVLSPVQQWYYKNNNSSYEGLPTFRDDCKPNNSNNMEVIYPKRDSDIFVPRTLSGGRGEVVFELAHKLEEVKVFWYIDKELVKSTESVHKISLSPGVGKHTLLVADSLGEVVKVYFEVEY